MKIGEEVRHKKLKKRGSIVELLRDNQAKIAIGSITISVSIDDLEVIGKDNKKN